VAQQLVAPLQPGIAAMHCALFAQFLDLALQQP